MQADLDRLGRLHPFVHPDLEGLQGDDAEHWRRIYCGPIGAEFMHFPNPDRSGWVAARMEAPAEPLDRQRILTRLAESELFERFLHSRYVGSKRYSLEGAAALIPLLDGILEAAAQRGVEVAMIAMSHRGRLTVMRQVIGTRHRRSSPVTRTSNRAAFWAAAM